MPKIEMQQVVHGHPPFFCKECGKVSDGPGKCNHIFEKDIIICDYAGIWQRKQIEGLYKRRVTLLVNNLPNDDWKKSVDLHYFASQEHLAKILTFIKNRKYTFNTVATHNYGDYTPVLVSKYYPSAVLVVHDIHHLGLGTPVRHEARLLKSFDRIIFPSSRMAAGLVNYLKPTAKTLVQHQMVPEKYFTDSVKTNDVIYQGRINDSWGSILNSLKAKGLKTRILPSLINLDVSYKQFGKIEPMRNYQDIIKACSESKWGLAGSITENKSMKRSMSNKFYDYIAAGCVPIIVNHPGVADVANTHKVGIVAKDINHINAIVKDEELYKRLHTDLLQNRSALTMESQKKEWEAFC